MGERLVNVPVDGCSQCLTKHRTVLCSPLSTRPNDSGGVTATYRCGICGNSWWTNWSREAVSSPSLIASEEAS